MATHTDRLFIAQKLIKDGETVEPGQVLGSPRGYCTPSFVQKALPLLAAKAAVDQSALGIFRAGSNEPLR